MSKIIKAVSGSFEVPIVTWDQYFNFIPRTKLYQTIEAYNVHLGYGDMSVEAEPTDSCYLREAVIVQDLTDPSAVLQAQLLEQLDKHVKVQHLSPDLQESMEIAIFQALENFSPIDSSALVKLSDTEYLLAPYTSDDLQIKMLSIDQGAVAVYRPKMFVRFSLNPIV